MNCSFSARNGLLIALLVTSFAAQSAFAGNMNFNQAGMLLEDGCRIVDASTRLDPLNSPLLLGAAGEPTTLDLARPPVSGGGGGSDPL